MVAARPLTEPEPRLFTWDDFILLDDEDKRELIDGCLVEVEVPTSEHEAFVVALASYLYFWAQANGGGSVLGSGYKVRIRKDRGVMPDIQYFRPGRSVPLQGLTVGAPDLAVEVISPSSGRYDRKVKFEYYQSIGAPEYWIVDLEDRVLTRYVLSDGRYAVAHHYDDTETLSPETFPGLAVPLVKVFPKVPATEAEPVPESVSDADPEPQPS